MGIFRIAVAVLLALVVAGCGGGTDYRYQARLRHSAASGCSVDRLQVTELARRQYYVWGCMTAGTYSCQRDGRCEIEGEMLNDAR